MKFLRYGSIGLERPSLLDDQGRIQALSAYVEYINRVALSPAMLERLRKLPIEVLSTVKGNPHLGAGVGNARKLQTIPSNQKCRSQTSLCCS